MGWRDRDRMLAIMKGLTDTMMDVRNGDEDLQHLAAEMERTCEEEGNFLGWPTPFSDLMCSIIELIVNELD